MHLFYHPVALKSDFVRTGFFLCGIKLVQNNTWENVTKPGLCNWQLTAVGGGNTAVQYV